MRRNRKRKSQGRERSEISQIEEAEPSRPRAARGFNPDYRYVIQDLKRIGFLATFFIALLIVLSVILP